MEGRLSAVCALILVLGAVGHSDAESIRPIRDHPGVCPRPAFCDNLQFCATARFAVCSHDSECNIDEKCCDNGCARVCTKAIRVKPGVCPRFPWIRDRICVLNVRPVCIDDFNCPGNEKCCRDQCGPVCAKPLKVKPGLCPDLKSLKALADPQWWRQCSHDYHCPKNEKCCLKGCESMCVEAVKPGHCRPSHLEVSLRCSRQRPCSHDFDCPHDWKCCKNQCGKVCSPPYNWRG